MLYKVYLVYGRGGRGNRTGGDRGTGVHPSSRSVLEASDNGSDPIIRKYQIDNKATRADSLIQRLNDGDLDVNPPYQRGDVWNEERQRSLIKSIIMGLPVGSIFINHRGLMEPDVVVDGKQRLEAIRAFLAGDLKVPKSWFGGEFFETDVPDDVGFTDMGDVGQRLWKNSAVINVSETKLQENPIEDETETFNLINFAGVEQGQSDFDEETTSAALQQ